MNFTVTLHDFLPLMPAIIVALTAIVVMILTSLKRSHNLIATASVIGLNIALFYLLFQWASAIDAHKSIAVASVMGMFMVDSFTQFYQIMILIAALACCTLSHAYIDSYKNNKEELYVLMLFSVVGAMLLVASSHYASFFISLELMSIPVYGLLAYTHQRGQSLEAGVKYLVLSATASAMLLMGMAYVYAYTGNLSFYVQADGVMPATQTLVHQMEHNPFVVLGLGMMLFAVAFKLSLAPFHKWTPDVYQGSPAPIATFLATAAKVATLGFLIRYLLASGIIGLPSIKVILTVFAVASIILGNLLALRQTNLKRILAYSSIAHFGYILLAPISMMFYSIQSVTMYILTYTLTTIGAFGVITLMSSPYRQQGNDIDQLSAYNGLFWRHPILSATLTVMMLSLAGVPATAGFIAKFLIVKDLIDGQSWLLAILLIVGSGIGLYYYLRVIVTLYKKPVESAQQFSPQENWGKQVGGVMVLLVSALVLILGLYPDAILSVLDKVDIVSPLHDYLMYLNNGGGHEGHHH